MSLFIELLILKFNLCLFSDLFQVIRGGSEMTKTKNNRVSARKKRVKWYLHVLIFAVMQFVFYTLDGYNGWHIFNLNSLGEKAVQFLSPLVEWFAVYENPHFNLVTVVWGIILIINGLLSLFYPAWSKRKASVREHS